MGGWGYMATCLPLLIGGPLGVAEQAGLLQGCYAMALTFALSSLGTSVLTSNPRGPQ